MKFSFIGEDLINKFLQQHLDRGQWSKAAEQYKKLIKLHPENITLRLRLAEVCVKAGNKKDALEQYQAVATHYESIDNFTKAVTILRSMLNLDPSLSHVRIKLAELYAKLGDTENLWSQYVAAFKYLEEKQLIAQSVTVLEQMAEVRLDDPKLMLQLAELFVTRNLHSQAISQFLSVAEFFLQKNEHQEAAKYYKRALKLDAGSKEAQIGLEMVHQLEASLKSENTQVAEKEAVEEVKEEDVVVAVEKAAKEVARKVTENELEDEIVAALQNNKIIEPEPLEFPGDVIDKLLASAVSPRIIPKGNFENHYSLGILYQEMTLFDAAIEEFVVAATDPTLQQKCYQMMSKCFKRKGMPDHAQKFQQLSAGLH